VEEIEEDSGVKEEVVDDCDDWEPPSKRKRGSVNSR